MNQNITILTYNQHKNISEICYILFFILSLKFKHISVWTSHSSHANQPHGAGGYHTGQDKK